MADYINIHYYLDRAMESWQKGDYLEAAVNAYWCIQYCENGEPYGMSKNDLSKAETEARKIFRSASRKFKKSILSKTTFIYGTICPKLLWLYKNKYNLRSVSGNTQKKFDAGHNIGNLAQKIFPNGIDASAVDSEHIIDMSRIGLPFNLKQQLWINKTKQNYTENTVYEAAFIYDEIFAAVDILVKGDSGHIAYEVKSCRSISDVLINDCALQYYVISNNCKLDDFFLVYINESYLNEIQIPLEEINENNADINRLFIKESVLSRIIPLQDGIKNQVKKLKSVLKGGEPTVKIGEQCSSPYECIYTNYCNKSDSSDFDIWMTW